MPIGVFFFSTGGMHGAMPCQFGNGHPRQLVGASTRVTLSGMIWDATNREIQSSGDEEKTHIYSVNRKAVHHA